jgi:hypothetical protein
MIGLWKSFEHLLISLTVHIFKICVLVDIVVLLASLDIYILLFYWHIQTLVQFGWHNLWPLTSSCGHI